VRTRDARHAPAVFVGRERELDALLRGLETASGGSGRLFLVSGEPGIGKSRLADELTAEARRLGARVLWGRSWEAGGAPAYWPWVQSLRSLVHDLGPRALGQQVGPGLAQVAQLVPDLRELVPALPPVPASDPDTARFRLFEATAAFVKRAAEERPLVFVLDDLHVADTPSLLLLEFLAGDLGDAHVLILAAYRDTELDPQRPLATRVAELARQTSTRRLRLRGIDEPAVARFFELTAGLEPDPGLVALVHSETEGNPLFVGEVVQLLAAEGALERPADAASWRLAVPEGVREVITRRLARLSEEANRVLALASVLGRDFDLESLERLAGLTRDELLDLLDEAAAARIVAEMPETLGRMRFSHALVRDALYDELPPARRVRHHRSVGEALEARYRGDLEPHLAELAHHFVRAAPGGDVDGAVEYARRAADRAVGLLAFEEAVRLFRLALQALDLRPTLDARVESELLIGLGDAQARAGDGPGARETFLRAAAVARGLQTSDLLASAALGYGGRFLWARAGTDPHLIPLLEEALAALPVADSPLRVRVLTRLAGALRDQHDRAPRAALSEKAVEMARRLGDPDTLAFALEGRTTAILWPENPDERIALAAEQAYVAAGLGDRERAAQPAYARVMAALELGDMPAVTESLDDYARTTEDLRQPAWQWLLVATRATLALFDGRLAEAEGLIEDALAIGGRAQASDAVLSHRVQLFTLRLHRGGLAGVEDMVRRSIVEYPARPMFRCMLGYLLAELGRGTDAHALLDDLADDRFAGLPLTNEWLLSLGFLADVAHALGDAERAATLYELLLPYAGRNASTADYIATGSVSRPLGVAAATASRWREAERHFDEALAENSRMGARPWVAWSAVGWADMLRARDGPGDRERAAELFARAAVTARELGMGSLEERAERLAEGATPADGGRGIVLQPTVFRREGEYWAVAYEGDAFRLRDSKGLRYLGRLLAEPGRELHVLALVAAERGPAPAGRKAEPGLAASSLGDAGEILDARAKEEYRRRLAELEDEIEEARAFADAERAVRAEEERDFLARELAAALGLRGRHRRAGSPAERARVSVTRAIRAALRRVQEQSPALGTHLERTIHTGTYCSYTPDPRLPVDWQL